MASHWRPALRKAKGEMVAFFGQYDLMAEVALEAVVREALRTGAKLVYPNGTVQHAGVVGVAEHAFKGLAADAPGHMSRARSAQQYSAVTAAFMLCRAETFLDVGGFDARELAVAFNDADLCLKVARRGGRVIWTPAVVAEHHESLSRGDDMVSGKAARFFRENYVMFQRWHEVLGADPFYSPHFSRERGVFSNLR